MKTKQAARKQTKMKAGLGSRLFDIFNVLFMCLLIVIISIPLLHVLSASFSNPADYIRHEGLLLRPVNFCLDAYRAVAKNRNILTGYANTIFIVVVGTVLSVIMSIVAAYCLSRRDVMWNGFLTMAIVFSMYFSGGMIPFYLVVKGVGLNHSIWAMIIPSLMNTHNLIVMRTAMVTVPESLEESAKLDGASYWKILWKIMVPLVKPTIAVICLYYAVSYWNAWFNAMLFIRDRAGYPLQLILREILIQNDTSAMSAGEDYLLGETIQFATIVVSTVPILMIYPFIQKYFVKGVMVGAVKG